MFSDEKIHKLISLYQSEVVLWCISSPDYHKTPLRDSALKRISDEMGENFTGDIVKKKLEVLRGQYVRELHNYLARKRSGSGTDDVPLPKWRFFSQLDDFLRSVVTPKATVSNYVPTSAADEREDDEENEEPSSMMNDQSQSQRRVSSSPSSSSKPQKRKLSNQDVMERALETMQSMQQYRQKHADEEMDGDALFAKLVHGKLKEIASATKKVRVKYEIEMLLVKATEGEVSAKNPSAAPVSAWPPFRPYNL